MSQQDPEATRAAAPPPPGLTGPAGPPPPDAAPQERTVLPADAVDRDAPSLARASGAARAVRGPLGPGATIGPYHIVRELGRGGMGAVYVALHATLQREVALKVMLRPTPRVEERFLREARAAARLHHPGIVTLHDVGQDAGRVFLGMELVVGESLKDRLDRGGPLEPREAARVVAGLADALAHAHEQGVLHRDLKPANVLLARDGRALLTDFGLAKDLREERAAALTATGELMGTPAFMAPEQAEGQAKRVDARADVYGLGATLYAALAGCPPFTAASAINLVVKVCKDRPEPPSKHAPGVPPALDALVLRCLEKDPAQRPASARALADELRRFLEPREPGLREVGARPRRVAVSLLALALAAAVVVIGVLALKLGGGGAPGATDGPPAPSSGAPEAAPPPPPPPAAPATPPPAGATRPAEGAASEEAAGTWAWVEVTPEHSPLGRTGAEAAFAYDERLGEVVLAGGWVNSPETGDEPINDVWSWDGARWALRGEYGQHLYLHALAWHGARGQLLLYGGAPRDRTPVAELLAWSGGAWQPLAPRGPGPGPRLGHAMVHAPDRGSVLLFGGRLPDNRESDELWEWDGQGWKAHPRGDPHPPPRTAAAAVYDTRRGVLVVLNGARGRGYLDDLWEWKDGVWRQRQAGGPGRRLPAGVAFDGQRTLVFGGASHAAHGYDQHDDTWSWDGSTWRQLETVGRPTPRARSCMAYDPRRGVVVLFGGSRPGVRLDDTWELRRTRR